jgi:putative oxidoreductase
MEGVSKRGRGFAAGPAPFFLIIPFMKKLEPYAYSLLRIVAGGMLAFHSCQKILGVLSEFRPPAGSQLWVGGLIELFGGLAVCLGIGTSAAAFLCSGMMAGAYFQFHWKLRFDSNFFPAINKGEPAVLYCFVFLLIACAGSGRWSLGKR